MAITNYGELKSAIASWLDRTDLQDKIPDFITVAEAKFFRVLRTPGNEQWVTYQADAVNAQTFQIPNDYMSCKILMYGTRPLARITDIDYLNKLAQSGAAGQPQYFCRIKDQIYLYPQADTAEDINLVYYQAQGPMVEDTDTTRTLTFAPDLYLYSALMAAQAYLIGDDRLPVWSAELQATMATLNDSAEDNETDGSTMSVSSIY